METKRILVSGSLAYDRIMDFPGRFKEHFLPDKLHALSVSFGVGTPREDFGGTAGNIAYTLALLGEHPTILANAGTDFAHYDAWLAKNGIDHASLAVSSDLPTSSAYIITDMDDNQITAFSPAVGGVLYVRAIDFTDAALGIIGAGNPADMTAQAGAFRNAKLPFFYDPGQQIVVLSADDIRAGIDGAEALLVNDYELALVKDKIRLDEAGILAKAKAIIVTLGVEGSCVITKDGEERVNAVKALEALDPTGAGDAYRAGFLTGVMKGLPLATCAKMGSVAGAYAVECYGTQNHRFTPEDFAKRYEAAYDEKISF